jgi:hypothetical protein
LKVLSLRVYNRVLPEKICHFQWVFLRGVNKDWLTNFFGDLNLQGHRVPHTQ